MELRNIQRSGSTHYVYLPAQWCKENSISLDSKVELNVSPDGKLMLSVFGTEKPKESLIINVPDGDDRFVNNYIKAAFLNPLKSFKIKLNKDINPSDILRFKEHMGGIDFVEFSNKEITCESPTYSEEPDVLLSMIVRKMLSMINLIIENHNKELVERYEEEIDRNNISIRKSAMGTLTFKRPSKLKHIELFYIVEISAQLEKIADHVVKGDLSKEELKHLSEILKLIQKVMNNSDIEACKTFFNLIHEKEMKRIHNHLNAISDVFIDWSITKMIL